MENPDVEFSDVAAQSCVTAMKSSLTIFDCAKIILPELFKSNIIIEGQTTHKEVTHNGKLVSALNHYLGAGLEKDPRRSLILIYSFDAKPKRI